MKKLFVVIGIMLAISVLSLQLTTDTVSAATAANCTGSSGGFLGFPTWYKYLTPSFSGTSCEITFNFPQDIGKVFLAVIEILLRISGLVAVAYVVYGGIKYVLSQGEPDKTKSAKNTIINALIGAAIAVTATGLVNLVARTLI